MRRMDSKRLQICDITTTPTATHYKILPLTSPRHQSKPTESASGGLKTELLRKSAVNSVMNTTHLHSDTKDDAIEVPVGISWNHFKEFSFFHVIQRKCLKLFKNHIRDTRVIKMTHHTYWKKKM